MDGSIAKIFSASRRRPSTTFLFGSPKMALKNLVISASKTWAFRGPSMQEKRGKINDSHLVRTLAAALALLMDLLVFLQLAHDVVLAQVDRLVQVVRGAFGAEQATRNLEVHLGAVHVALVVVRARAAHFDRDLGHGLE